MASRVAMSRWRMPYLADITEEDQRSENFGKMAISGNLGFILGPAVAGLLGATIWGEVLPVVAALVASLIATLVIAFGLKESNPCVLLRDPEPASVRKIFGQETKECFRIDGANKASARELLKIRFFPVLLAIYFLVMAGFSFFYITFRFTPSTALPGLLPRPGRSLPRYRC